MKSEVHGIITSIYLISWISIGNYVFLNLFLAILLDGFASEDINDNNEALMADEDEEVKINRIKLKD